MFLPRGPLGSEVRSVIDVGSLWPNFPKIHLRIRISVYDPYMVYFRIFGDRVRLNPWNYGAGEAIRTPDPNLGKIQVYYITVNKRDKFRRFSIRVRSVYLFRLVSVSNRFSRSGTPRSRLSKWPSGVTDRDWFRRLIGRSRREVSQSSLWVREAWSRFHTATFYENHQNKFNISRTETISYKHLKRI